ncbi:hypothetical protein [Aliivibrio fischeri]|uniref:hypothetical protein n=1 Tax=Aliivibrio fischeri TaxID=668 RepID=UPI0012DACCB1|nr:hypothetical protein [Aliivibrio fischeri]MUJ36893.1 hypothetical protein [Aliivibrio fischeri]
MEKKTKDSFPYNVLNHPSITSTPLVFASPGLTSIQYAIAQLSLDHNESVMDFAFEYLQHANLSQAKEFRIRGYNRFLPQFDFSLRDELEQHVQRLESDIELHGININSDQLRDVQIIAGKLRSQIECISQVQDQESTQERVEKWIEAHVPKKIVGEARPLERALGVTRHAQPEEHYGSRKVAQSLVRRLEGALKAMSLVAQSLSELVINSNSEQYDIHIERELIREMAHDYHRIAPVSPSPEMCSQLHEKVNTFITDEKLDEKAEVDSEGMYEQAKEAYSAQLSEEELRTEINAITAQSPKDERRRLWLQIRDDRVVSALEQRLTFQNKACDDIQNEITKLDKKLNGASLPLIKNIHLQPSSSLPFKGEACTYLAVTEGLLSNALAIIKTEKLKTANRLSEELKKLKQYLPKEKNQTYSMMSIAVIEKGVQEIKSGVVKATKAVFVSEPVKALSQQLTKLEKSVKDTNDKVLLVANKAKGKGHVSYRVLDEKCKDKETSQLISDSIVRSVLWQLQQSMVDLQQAAQPLLSSSKMLAQIKAPLPENFDHEFKSTSSPSPLMDILLHKRHLESPEMKMWTKQSTLNEILVKHVEQVKAAVKALETNERSDSPIDILAAFKISFYKKATDLSNELMSALDLSLAEQEEINNRCHDLLMVGDKPLLERMAKTQFEVIELLNQAVGLAISSPCRFSQVKDFTERAILKSLLMKVRLAERSAQETGRDLDDTSRGARIAKHWAMILAEKIEVSQALPSPAEVLALINRYGLNEETHSSGDPKGALMATRLSAELARAQAGTLLPVMTPERYAEYEKDLVEFMVAWGQRRFTRGMTEHVFELALSIPTTFMFNIFSPLYRLPLASLRIPYKVYKTKSLIMPGSDKPYKAIDMMVKKRMKQLGFHMVTSPMPTVMKTALGGVLAGAGYVYNKHVSGKEQTLDGIYEQVVNGKQSQQLRMDGLGALALRSVTALSNSGFEVLSDHVQRQVLTLSTPVESFNSPVVEDELLDEVWEDSVFDEPMSLELNSDSAVLRRVRRSLDSGESQSNSPRTSAMVDEYYTRFNGDVLLFKEKAYNKLRGMPLGEARTNYIKVRLKKAQRMVSLAENEEQKRFLQSAVSILERACDSESDIDCMSVFYPPLSQVDGVLYESINTRFEITPKYEHIQMLINYQKSLWSEFLTLDKASFESRLEEEFQKAQHAIGGRFIYSRHMSSQEELNYHALILIKHLQVEVNRYNDFEEQVQSLVNDLKSSQMNSDNYSVSELHQTILERAREGKQSSPHSFDRVMYTLCEQALSIDLKQAEYQEHIEKITSTIFTDIRFDDYKVSLLPSERIFVRNNLSLSSENLSNEILAYRTGKRLSLHINIEDIEHAYLNSLEDRLLPDGSLSTRQDQIDEITLHGGLIAYEQEILRSNRIIQAQRSIELASLSHKFWQDEGISQPNKVSYVYNYPYLPAADLYTMPNENAPRAAQIDNLEYIKRIEPAYNRVIESKMGPKYLHVVNRDELRSSEINWDVDHYRQCLEQRLIDLVAVQPEEEKAYLEQVLPRVLTPPRYTTDKVMSPYFIKPSIHDLPLENMLLLKDGDRYTVISLLPPSGRIEIVTGHDELKSLFTDLENHEWVLSHASLYNQMDGRHQYGMESALEGLRARTSNWSFMSETSNHRMSEPDVLRSIARSSMGTQGSGRYLRTNLVEAASNSYWEGISGEHSIEISGDYSLPDKFNEPNGTASFERLYEVQKQADIQRLAEQAIDQFKEEHFDVYSAHLKATCYRLIEEAWRKHEDTPLMFRSNLLIDKMHHEFNEVNISLPGLVGKRGGHVPLEGMMMFHDPDPRKAQYVMVSLLGEGALVEFNSKMEVYQFFANPGNRHFLLSHISEYNKQNDVLGVSTPADTLGDLEEQSLNYPSSPPVGISPYWASTETTFEVPMEPIEARSWDLIGTGLQFAIQEGIHNATTVTTEALHLDFIPLSHDRSVNMFDTLANRNLQRLTSDADALFKSHDEWRTEKALEITSAVLAVPAVVLSVAAVAASGGAAALPLAAAALAVDSVSFAVSLAEASYIISQGDTEEERTMGYIPLALAPLDLLGVASSTNDVLKALKVLKTSRATIQVADNLDDIVGATGHTANRMQDGIAHLNTSLTQPSDLSALNRTASNLDTSVTLSHAIDEQLEQIRCGIEELNDLEIDLNNLTQDYPVGTAPMASLTDFTLDEQLQVAVQRLSAPKIVRGKWGGMLVDDGGAMSAVRSSHGEYLFSDTPTGAKSIGISASNEATLMQYLDRYAIRQVASDIDELSEIYVRVGPRPGSTRLKGLFPVEDATKGVINGVTNLSIRTGGIQGPTMIGMQTPGGLAKPLSSVIARYKKIIGWEKSLSGGKGHGLMLEISPYLGAGMIKVGDGNVSFGDIATALRRSSQELRPQVASHTSEIGLKGRSMNWNSTPIRRPMLGGQVWEGHPNILPGSDDDLRLYLELGGNPEQYLETLKEVEPEISVKGFMEENKRWQGKVESGRFFVKESKQGSSWELGNWQQEVNWRFKYRKGLVETTEELDKRILKASQNDTSYGHSNIVVALNDAKQSGGVEPKVVRWLQASSMDIDSQDYRAAFGLLDRPVNSTLEVGDISQSGFLHLCDRDESGNKRFHHVIYVHVSSDGIHFYQIDHTSLQQELGQGVILRELKDGGTKLHTKHLLDEDSIAAFNHYLSTNDHNYVFTSVDDVHRDFVGTQTQLIESNDEFEVVIGNQSRERMQVLSPSKLVGRVTLGGDTSQILSDPLVQYTDRFKGQVNVQAVSIHADADGFFYYKDHINMNSDRMAHTPAEFVQYLQTQGIDLTQGSTPVHLLACYAKSSGSAQSLADEIGRPVIAYSNRKLQINTSVLEDPSLELTSEANKLRQLLAKDDFKPASHRVFYPENSSNEVTNASSSKDSLPLRSNEFLGNKTIKPRSQLEQNAVDHTADIVKATYQKYQSTPLENCENAAREIVDTLKAHPSYSDVRLGNMAFWEGAHGRNADSYMNHWVVMTKFNGIELVLDPTAHQFSNKLNISTPVLDTYENWVATYQAPLSNKRMMLVKIAEVPHFSSAPFKSNDEFSGFRYIKDAKVLSSSRWYHQSGYDQYIGSLIGNVRKTFFEAEPSTAFAQGTFEGSSSILDGGNGQIKYFSRYKQGKIQEGVFLVSLDSGATWRRGSWKEEVIFRLDSRNAPLALSELDQRINRASNRDSSYSRICYTGAFNDAEQAGTISPNVAEQLHRVIAKRDEAGQIMMSDNYQAVFELEGRHQRHFDRSMFKESGFLHVGEVGSDDLVHYDHIVYVHVNESGVCFYQVNGSDFQLALGDSDEIGINVSASHGKHMMNDTRVAAFERYFVENPEAVFTFTTVKQVSENVQYKQALAAMVQEGLIDYDTYKSSNDILEAEENVSGFVPQESTVGTKYVYFPSLNRELINSRFIPLLRHLKRTNAAPFEIVFKNREQVQDFQRILTETYGSIASSTLEPDLQYLYSVGKTNLHDLSESDTLHINGVAYIGEFANGEYSNVGPLAQELVAMGLPARAMIKITNKAAPPTYFLTPFSKPNEEEFDNSFAGQLERELVTLQSERGLGLVSSNSGVANYQSVDSTVLSVIVGREIYTRGDDSAYCKVRGIIDYFQAQDLERHRVFDPLPTLEKGEVTDTDVGMNAFDTDRRYAENSDPLIRQYNNGQGDIILQKDRYGECSSRTLYISRSLNSHSFESALSIARQRTSVGKEPINILLLKNMDNINLIEIIGALSRAGQYDEAFFYTGEPFSDLVEIIKRPDEAIQENEQVLELRVTSLNKEWVAHALHDDPFIKS